MLVLLSSVLVGALLGLPFIPPHWLWRFLLMEFIPASIIVGCASSVMRSRTSLAIFLILCLSPVILQSYEAALRTRPTIGVEEYQELQRLGEVVQPNSVVITHFPIAYWVQYVTRCDVAKQPSPGLWQSYRHVYLLYQRGRGPPPHPPPESRILFQGKRFILFELLRPPA